MSISGDSLNIASLSLDSNESKSGEIKRINKEDISNIDEEDIQLFYDGLYSFPIVIDGYQFYINPTMAISHSIFFRDMIKDNMKEVRSGIFTFPDLTIKIKDMKSFTNLWNWINGFNNYVFPDDFETSILSIEYMNYFQLDFKRYGLDLDYFEDYVCSEMDYDDYKDRNTLKIMKENRKLISGFFFSGRSQKVYVP